MNELPLIDPLAVDPFDDPFRTFMRPWLLETAGTAPRIRIDLSERDGSYALKADLPGVRKEDIDVRVDGHQLTISAEAKGEPPAQANGGRMLRQERLPGFASRTLTLACPIDEAAVQASYQDGVLALTLPKKADMTGQRITVR